MKEVGMVKVDQNVEVPLSTVVGKFLRFTVDSCKVRFAQTHRTIRERWFAQFYGCFAQGSCYVVFLSN